MSVFVLQSVACSDYILRTIVKSGIVQWMSATNPTCRSFQLKPFEISCFHFRKKPVLQIKSYVTFSNVRISINSIIIVIMLIAHTNMNDGRYAYWGMMFHNWYYCWTILLQHKKHTGSFIKIGEVRSFLSKFFVKY